MKLAIMQPYFFPYIGYYQAISAVDKYILYDNLNYIKEGFVNRNRYLVVNGSPSYFIVPIRHKSSFTKIRDVELVAENTWKRKMLNSFYCHYKRAPYFKDVIPVIENVLYTDTTRLTTLNTRTIIEVSRYLDIATEITADISEYYPLEEKLECKDEELPGLFPYIRSRFLDRKVIRVIEICKTEKADVFINAIGGQALYSKEDFAHHHIALFFIKTEEFTYPQQSSVFYPNLSIIDVLMNCGKEKTKDFLSKYTLV